MLLKKLLSIVFFVFISFFGLVASAAENASAPVMIIRFNQDFVNYKTQLQKVAKSAIAAKPSVLFDIVSVVPQTGSSGDDKKIKERSTFLTNQVVESLQLSGAKADQIRTTFQDSTLAESGEVHIFVR
jgi:hypothetical protein